MLDIEQISWRFCFQEKATLDDWLNNLTVSKNNGINKPKERECWMKNQGRKSVASERHPRSLNKFYQKSKIFSSRNKKLIKISFGCFKRNFVVLII